jgi:hypothetical protein
MASSSVATTATSPFVFPGSSPRIRERKMSLDGSKLLDDDTFSANNYSKPMENPLLLHAMMRSSPQQQQQQYQPSAVSTTYQQQHPSPSSTSHYAQLSFSHSVSPNTYSSTMGSGSSNTGGGLRQRKSNTTSASSSSTALIAVMTDSTNTTASVAVDTAGSNKVVAPPPKASLSLGTGTVTSSLFHGDNMRTTTALSTTSGDPQVRFCRTPSVLRVDYSGGLCSLLFATNSSTDQAPLAQFQPSHIYCLI